MRKILILIAVIFLFGFGVQTQAQTENNQMESYQCYKPETNHVCYREKQSTDVATSSNFQSPPQGTKPTVKRKRKLPVTITTSGGIGRYSSTTIRVNTPVVNSRVYVNRYGVRFYWNSRTRTWVRFPRLPRFP